MTSWDTGESNLAQPQAWQSFCGKETWGWRVSEKKSEQQLKRKAELKQDIFQNRRPLCGETKVPGDSEIEGTL